MLLPPLPPLRAAAGLPGRVEQCRWSRAPLPAPAPLPARRAGVPRLVSLRLRRRAGGGPRRSAPAARRAPRARCRCSFRAWALMPAGMGGRQSGVQPLQPPPGAPPPRRSTPRVAGGMLQLGAGMERPEPSRRCAPTLPWCPPVLCPPREVTPRHRRGV